MEKIVKCKSQSSLNIAIKKLREKGWRISCDEYFEKTRGHEKLYCIKMKGQESSLSLE